MYVEHTAELVESEAAAMARDIVEMYCEQKQAASVDSGNVSPLSGTVHIDPELSDTQ
jgi:hypothetical protein